MRWEIRKGCSAEKWLALTLLLIESLSLLSYKRSRMIPTILAVVQLLSHVRLFVTPWTAACQASLSFIISHSLLKLMTMELVMPSNHLIICRSLFLLPSIFPSILRGQFFTSGGQSTGASVSASDLPVNIQGWFPLELTGLISLLSKGHSRVFFSTIVWKH